MPQKNYNPLEDLSPHHGPDINKLAKPIEELIFTPGKGLGLEGYGLTINERYRKYTTQQIQAIRGRKIHGAAVLLVAILVGVTAGIAATALNWGVALLSKLFMNMINPAKHNLWLIFVPVAGIMLAGIFQKYILKRQIYHGIGRLDNDFRKSRCYLPVELTYSPVIASIVTLGFGGSAGAADPIAYAGASIGSNIGSLFRLPPKFVRAMTAIGAGAGIAGMFKAPISGALFAIEVLSITMSATSVAALILACTVSGVTAYLLTGLQGAIPIHQMIVIPLDGFEWIIMFGILCGLYCYYYTNIMQWMNRKLAKIKTVIGKFIFAGLIVGMLIFLFPGLYGEGYELIGKLLEGDYYAVAAGGIMTDKVPLSAIVLVGCSGMMLVKAFATSTTICGGGVAGEFAPAIMVGAIAGLLYAFLMNHLLHVDISYPAFIIMGMAGVLAGAVRAPLTATFLITEIATTQYGQFLPIATVAGLSYLVVSLLDVRERKRNARHAKGAPKGKSESQSDDIQKDDSTGSRQTTPPVATIKQSEDAPTHSPESAP